jgi:heavy metal sensor kinase
MRREQPFDERAMTLTLSGKRLYADATFMGHHLRVLSIPLKDGPRVVGGAQFASNLDDMDAAMARLRNVLLAMLPLSLAATWVLGIWLTRRSLRPVRAITETAERIEAASLSDRLPVHGNDEFAILSARFNSMLARIEASFRSLEDAYETQRRFVADASHELKTPLTTVKGRVGVASRGPQTVERYAEHMAAIGRAADSMSTIIQDLLLLASSDENRLTLHISSQNLRQIVQSAVAATPLGRRRPTRIEVPEDMTADVDPDLFARALGNLLSNAGRYTPGNKDVFVRAASTGAGVRIEVADEGEGISPEHLSRVFDRFYRVDPSRERGSGGTGLGLPIVRSIVEAHGGTVSIDSIAGKGTTVTILLPAE